MKRKVLHRVPLVPRAMEILGRQHERRDAASDLVFSSRNDTPPSGMILTAFLRKKKVPSDLPGRFATAHGFRSSFRDWASENGYARDSAERALSHAVKNAVEAAYHRTDLLEKRRPMMTAWEDFCLGRG
jgi:integrase